MPLFCFLPGMVSVGILVILATEYHSLKQDWLFIHSRKSKAMVYTKKDGRDTNITYRFERYVSLGSFIPSCPFQHISHRNRLMTFKFIEFHFSSTSFNLSSISSSNLRRAISSTLIALITEESTLISPLSNYLNGFAKNLFHFSNVLVS